VQTNDNEEIMPDIKPAVHNSGSGGKIKNTRKVIVQRKEHVPLNNATKALQQISSILKEENESDVLGRSVGSQLKKMPPQDAFELQIQIQIMIAQRRLKVVADPRGNYTNPSPSSWSSSTSSSFPNTPNPQQDFGLTEEAEQSQTALDIDNGGTTEIICVFCIMYL
jgi:hypothetical protein